MIVKVLDSFKDEKSGSTVIEAALCIPVLLSLIFFILEMIKITILQSAIDSITLETTFDYCAFKDTEHFDSIIKKNLPPFVKNNNIRSYIIVYPSLSDLTTDSNYGNPVNYPSTASHSENVMIAEGVEDKMVDNRISSGCAFELTLVCDYEFSSPYIAKLFARDSSKSQQFLIWNRAICVCN